jgi:diguanylate cyclase (GGDEF)-like protein
MLLRLHHKALFPVALLTILSGVFTSFSLYAILSLAETNEDLVERFHELQTVQRIESTTGRILMLLVRASAGDEPRIQNDAYVALDELSRQLHTLRQNKTINQDEVPLLARLETQTGLIRGEMARVFALGGSQSTQQMRLVSRIAAQHFIPVHESLQAWYRVEMREVDEMRERSALRHRAYLMQAATLVTIATITLGFAFWYYMRTLVKPLLAISASTAILASGNLKHRLKPTSRDEVGLLARDINRMAASLDALTLRLNQAAETDSLTGLLNRRAFDSAIQRELHLLETTGTPLSVAVFDIDHFKLVNDTHGHAAGDRVLRQTSRLCTRHIRSGDYCFRYGGEEFVVMMPGVGLDEAHTSLERFRAAVAAEDFSEGESPLRITISFGLAVTPEDGTSRETLIQHADDALYAAKEGGRNRGVCFRDIQPQIE